MTLREALESLLRLCHFQIQENHPKKGETAHLQTQDWCIEELRKHEVKRREAKSAEDKREFAADVACCVAFALNAGYYDKKAQCVAECVDRYVSWALRDLHSLDDSPSHDRDAEYEHREIAFYTEEFVTAYDNDNGMASAMALACLVALARWLWCDDLLYPPKPEESKALQSIPAHSWSIYGEGY